MRKWIVSALVCLLTTTAITTTAIADPDNHTTIKNNFVTLKMKLLDDNGQVPVGVRAKAWQPWNDTAANGQPPPYSVTQIFDGAFEVRMLKNQDMQLDITLKSFVQGAMNVWDQSIRNGLITSIWTTNLKLTKDTEMTLKLPKMHRLNIDVVDAYGNLLRNAYVGNSMQYQSFSDVTLNGIAWRGYQSNMAHPARSENGEFSFYYFSTGNLWLEYGIRDKVGQYRTDSFSLTIDRSIKLCVPSSPEDRKIEISDCSFTPKTMKEFENQMKAEADAKTKLYVEYLRSKTIKSKSENISKTIVCVKKASKMKLTSSNPKCPKGWKPSR